VIVYFAGSEYEGIAGTDRHVATRLSAMTPVLYVDPPRPAADHSGPWRIGADLWRLAPRVPPGAFRPGVHAVTTLLMRRAARRAAAALGQRITGVIVTTYDDLLGTAPGARTLFYATDDLVSGADLLGLPRRRLEAGQARQLAYADAVAAVSPTLAERLRRVGDRQLEKQVEANLRRERHELRLGRDRGVPHWHDVVVVPNGCDVDAYAAVDAAPWPADLPACLGEPGGEPVAGFVGHINGRIDIAVLEAVAAGGGPLLLVGPRHPGYQPARFPALVNRPNVFWVGPKPFAELPSYLRVIDVGLTPYRTTEFNRASFPLKTLEYLAASRGVVSADLPATAWLRGDPEGAALIRVARTPAEFVTAVPPAATRSTELARRRRAFARRHDWSERARTLAGLLMAPEVVH
jgi:teichuronic acid biosynthesis glycosyltransferase TuaH